MISNLSYNKFFIWFISTCHHLLISTLQAFSMFYTTYDFKNPNNALGSVYFNRPEIRKVAQSLSKTFRQQNDFKFKVDVTC